MTRPVLLLSLLLAACGSEPAARDAQVSNAAADPPSTARPATAARFEPGEWETVITIDSANIPGMSAGMMKELEARDLAKTTSRSCMTPEQAAKPDEAVFAGKRGNCRFDRYTMKDGKLDATMRCRSGAGGASAEIAMKGDFTRTGFTLANSMTAAPVPGHPPVTITSRVVGRRIGACKG